MFGYLLDIGINYPFVLAFCGSCDSRNRSFKDGLFDLPLNQIVFYLPNLSKSLVESIINSPFVPSYMQIMGSYNTFGVASYAIFLTTLYDIIFQIVLIIYVKVVKMWLLNVSFSLYIVKH